MSERRLDRPVAHKPTLPPPVTLINASVTGAVTDSFTHEGPGALPQINRWLHEIAAKANTPNGVGNMDITIHVSTLRRL